MSLLSAAQSGSVALVRAALASSTPEELRAIDPESGFTALHFACSSDDGAVVQVLVQVLVESGIDLAARSKTGNTCAHSAASSGGATALEVVVANDASLAAKTNNWNETPLHCAAAVNNIDAIRCLVNVSDNAELRAVRDRWGRTAQMVAVQHGYLKAAEACAVDELDQVDQVDQPEQDDQVRAPAPLKAFTQELMLTLNERLAHPENHAAKVVVQGIFSTHTETIGAPIPPPPPPTPNPVAMPGPPPPPPPGPPLPPPVPSTSASVPQPSIPKPSLFPKLKPTPKPIPSTPPSSETTAAQLPITRVPAPLSPSGTPKKSISSQIEYPGSLSALQSMLAQPDFYYINGKDLFGWTALHKYTSWNQPDLVRCLLQACTLEDVNENGNRDGFTPLHCALDNHAVECVELLVQDGRVDVHTIKDARGRSCLEYAQQLKLDGFLNK
ncbi:Ankyrin repeat domain-containing protein 44 [Rhizoclosmatium sp. JEL0117]|nr:Ankyrin repeat domain-containing protein 44 [Rhizoclosmatium sp. JEL0117]